MWRVLVPLVVVFVLGPVPEPTPTVLPTAEPPTRELLYVQAGWVTSASGRLYEGTSPTRCADGSIVYTREGDLWRDGKRLTSTAEVERNPSCVVDVVYEVDGYIWRLSGTSRVRLFEGEDPALHADGRIAYRARFQGVKAVYVWDGSHTLTYMGIGAHPNWGDVLYLHGDYTLGWWDGTIHWLDEPGHSPCWTPEGLYYVWGDLSVQRWDIYKDGVVVVEDAMSPAW